MDLPKPVRHEPKTEEELDLSGSKPLALHKESKGLAIALVTAAVVFLAAVGLGGWFLMQKNVPAEIVTKIDPNSTAIVKEVSWVAPTMPANFATQGQSTHQAETVYYPNYGEDCAVITNVTKAGDGSAISAAVVTANDGQGVTTKLLETLAQDPGITVSDSDGQRQYDFDAAAFTQDVSNPIVEKKQSGIAYYRQFGNNIASISYICNQATAEVNSESLLALVKQFTVKTER